MIRATFGQDPYKLNDKEFAGLLCEALFINKFKEDQMENSMLSALSKAFGAANDRSST